ncbi:MAG: molybdopterin-dependent oxidoreductase [Spirochaetaceae bacterium]|nr:molybdopterin-dependent oxidoreductase [Spirochaetaceae bacterium]
MASKIMTNFIVNGSQIRKNTESEITLQNFLRYELKLTGVKKGCSNGDCGSCTILLNGKPVKSCSLKMDHPGLVNSEIVTIEGLSDNEENLHPVQEAFVNAGALQCGYCTPGMIMTSTGLLMENPNPTRTEIRDYIGPKNICRCTGYQKIIDAVEDAGRVLRGEQSLLANLPDDAPLRRKDARKKVMGSLKYADDIEIDGMIFGKIKYADIPSAILIKIDSEETETVPGFIGMVTALEMKGSNKIGMASQDQPGIVGTGERIRSIADPLAAVFSVSEKSAQESLDLLKVEYKKLPGIFSFEEALSKDAPLIHEDKKENILYSGTLERGNPKEALNNADIVVSGNFTTSRAAHGYTEVESGYAVPDENGGVEIYYPTQAVFDDKRQVAGALGLDDDKVRVVQIPMGGAFGGKEDVLFQHILAAAAIKFNKTVKITLSREDSLRVVQKKHGIDFHASLGVDKNGQFTVLDVDIVMDTGAYASLGHDIIENAMSFAGGPYYIPELRINGKAVFSNNVMGGAMRGFGANQANYMIESLINMAAEKLQMDTIDIRLKNALKPGLPTVTDHILEPGIPGIVEALLEAKEAMKELSKPKNKNGKKYGIGVACGVKNVGFGHGFPESAGSIIELSEKGKCKLMTSHHEFGQGAAIGQSKIVSEVLKIPVGDITVILPDTAKTPFTAATTASMQTFMTGNATLGAARELLSDILIKASKKIKNPNPAALKLQGDSIVDISNGNKIKLSELGAPFRAEFRAFPPETETFPDKATLKDYTSPDFKSKRTHWAYAYGVQIALVEIDETTGKVLVKKIVTVSDLGRILNRRAVEGQQEGGVVMGVGYALSENYKSKDGINITESLGELGLTTADEAPEIINRMVEVPHPWGPLGVKGLAEAPSLATAPAITNAIFDATGVRIFDLPVNKELLKNKSFYN